MAACGDPCGGGPDRFLLGHRTVSANSINSQAQGTVLTSPSGEPTGVVVSEPLGIFDIFKVGIGPSSSHTNGPMTAGWRFITELRELDLFDSVVAVRIDLFGSLALTGSGHGTDKATTVGLAGKSAATVDPDEVEEVWSRAKSRKTLLLGGTRMIDFDTDKCIIFHMDAQMPQHPNGMRIGAFSDANTEVYHNEYLSIGGGFVQTVTEYVAIHGDVRKKSQEHFQHDADEEGPCFSLNIVETSEPLMTTSDTRNGSGTGSQLSLPSPSSTIASASDTKRLPHSFGTAAELLKLCKERRKTIADVMMENEAFLTCNGDMSEVESRIDEIWDIMWGCIQRGIWREGYLPVSGIPRQAPSVRRNLEKDSARMLVDHFAVMDWIMLYARAVNEENACGGRIVTAPTNGASGTLPAVLAYYKNFCPASSTKGVRVFLATAAAFGILLKTNASISGAEAGCQAEVGSACAMSAAGLCAALGGTHEQIENAAEIGLEHNLGMTCDPMGGLVQVPCIERNSVASIKAITAYRLASRGDGSHEVSFDSCVEAMYRTGLDMQEKYRETSAGGLALYARRPEHFKRAQNLRKQLTKNPSSMMFGEVVVPPSNGLSCSNQKLVSSSEDLFGSPPLPPTRSAVFQW